MSAPTKEGRLQVPPGRFPDVIQSVTAFSSNEAVWAFAQPVTYTAGTFQGLQISLDGVTWNDPVTVVGSGGTANTLTLVYAVQPATGSRWRVNYPLPNITTPLDPTASGRVL